jgi:hypothetical protein
VQNFYDYKKFAILSVDDEEKSLKYFARAFEEHFRILTAPNAQEGLKVLEQNQDGIAILMTKAPLPLALVPRHSGFSLQTSTPATLPLHRGRSPPGC